MSRLTYSIYYTPADDLLNAFPINYICSDNKIHSRFRDFNSEELIIGFEKKLAYLLTYLMNYSYLPRIIGDYDTDTLIKNFLKSSDVATIIAAVNIYNGSKIRGIRLRKNYNKKVDCKPFGDTDSNCFPLNIKDDIIQCGDLNSFLSKLKISLDEYLFNDSYVIILREHREFEVNKKFINKMNKKLSRLSSSNYNVEELW